MPLGHELIAETLERLKFIEVEFNEPADCGYHSVLVAFPPVVAAVAVDRPARIADTCKVFKPLGALAGAKAYGIIEHLRGEIVEDANVTHVIPQVAGLRHECFREHVFGLNPDVVDVKITERTLALVVTAKAAAFDTHEERRARRTRRFGAHDMVAKVGHEPRRLIHEPAIEGRPP